MWTEGSTLAAWYARRPGRYEEAACRTQTVPAGLARLLRDLADAVEEAGTDPSGSTGARHLMDDARRAARELDSASTILHGVTWITPQKGARYRQRCPKGSETTLHTV